ncbi:MAG: T9SS type A sorting domain-containing protein [bacterium]|nr:MAG: T9SS type A sorting domain-containing protein [bacterium]
MDMKKRKFIFFLFFWLHACLMNFGLLFADEMEEHYLNYLHSFIFKDSVISELPCGFVYGLALQQHWQELPFDVRLKLKKPYFNEPFLEDSMISPQGNFMLHFDRTGVDAVPETDFSGNGIPDFIDSAAAIFDYVRSYEIQVLGYQAPLGLDGNPVDIYHVFFQNLQTEYGSTFAKDEIPGPSDYYRYTSYIILDNDFQNSNYLTRGLSGLKMTAAHEFLHAIQLSNRIWWIAGEPADLFLMEMTSTWIEDVIYEEINNYLYYLPPLFKRFSNTSFTNIEDLYPYGNSLFWHMVEKRFGRTAATEVWAKVREKPGLDALNDFFTDYNSSLAYQIHQYGIWMNFTGMQADTVNFFPEGDLYPNLNLQAVDIYNFQNSFAEQKKVLPLASRVLQIYLESGQEYSINAVSTQYNGFCSHISASDVLNTVQFYQNGMFTLWSDPSVRIILTNTINDTAWVKYSLGTKLSGENDDFMVFPNPVILSENDRLSFVNIPEPGDIFVFNSIGIQIFHHTITNQYQIYSWDLKNKWGEPLSSGVYLFLFKSPNSNYTGKFTLVR